MDEVIVLLMREFGWSLEYTIAQVQSLPLAKLNAILNELQYQRAMEEYRTATNFAMVIANWASAQGKRRYSIKDFVGNPPRRAHNEAALMDVARKEGIVIPEGDSVKRTVKKQ